jgi:hypothetical protein
MKILRNVLLLILFLTPAVNAQDSGLDKNLLAFPLKTTDTLIVNRVIVSAEKYDGRDAVHVIEDPNSKGPGADRLAVLQGSDMTDGVIEVDVAGTPAANAGANARGFVGIAFRVGTDGKEFECIYLRPTNGRAEDPVRRSHAVQYESIPKYPWHKLRRETPGKYENEADLVPGQWTHVKIDIKGTTAKLYLHEAEEPSLVVNDLKLGKTHGTVALWIGPGTDAYFSNLTIRR